MTSAALPGCRAGRMYGSLELTTLVHRRRDQVNGSGSQRAQTQGAATSNTGGISRSGNAADGCAAGARCDRTSSGDALASEVGFRFRRRHDG